VSIAGENQQVSGGAVDFTDWYAAEMPRMAVAIRAAVLDHELADEAISEAFARAWLHWHKVKHMDSPRGWVYTVALNQARTIARRTKGNLDAIVDLPTAMTYDEHPSDTDELWRAVRRLAPQARRAIALRYIADLPEAEVADIMGARGTVAATLHRARKALAESLTELQRTEPA
jgi:RNA polymerase sigma-70 factor (ECF subfamily)